MPAETNGIEPSELIGRRIASVLLDDTESAVVMLEGGLYLIDANDAFYGNPLEAKHISEYEKLRAYYSESDRASFTDYWTAQPVPRDSIEAI